MKDNCSRPSYSFLLIRDEMLAYMSSNNSETLLTSLIGESIPASSTSQHMTIRNRIPSFRSTICIDLIEKQCWSTEPYMPGEDPNADTFQTSSEIEAGGNESSSLINLQTQILWHRHWSFKHSIPHPKRCYQEKTTLLLSLARLMYWWGDGYSVYISRLGIGMMLNRMDTNRKH